jgi:protein TonB
VPVAVNASFDEPTIPLRLQRPLAATWISLGLHVALIALVQVAPPAATNPGGTVIEARLVPPHARAPEVDAPEPLPGDMPLLASTETAEAVPVVRPVAPPPARTLPGPAATQSVPSATVEAPAAPASPVTITSLVDLTYYSAREVDVHPRALRAIEPDYPAEADRRKLSGMVRLQLKVEADGRVSDVEVVSSTPPGAFDESAIQAFRAARFEPAQKAGRPVRALVMIEVQYDWAGRPPQPLGTGGPE